MEERYAARALRRVPVQARSREKVERALAAAAALLEREGVAAITLLRVADEADISVGALHQYLPDRESILVALSADYHVRHEQLMDELVAALAGERAGERAGDPIGAVLGAVVELYRQQAGTRALRAALQSTAQLRLTREHKERMVAKVETLLIARGLAHPGDGTARAVFHTADALMHEAFASDDEGDPVLLRELERLLRAYLSQP